MGRLAIVALMLAGCVRFDTYQCGTSTDCGAGGVCEPNHLCSFVDTACDSDRSYGSGAGGLSGVCVPGDEPVDGAITDGAVVDGPPAIDAAVDAPAIDAPADAPEGPTVAHLARTDSVLGAGAWTINGTVTINTTTPSVNQPLPPGVTLSVAPQVPSGPDLVVLHVGDLSIADTGILRVIGSRGLVIVSSAAIINGRIDAGADQSIAGGGGSGPSAGPGAGIDGAHAGSFDDGGGGGAGHLSAGASGASDLNGAAGGAGGPLHGDVDLMVLEGGSGGGNMTNNAGCSPARAGGAGGGAIQIFAVGALAITSSGGVEAGGGGGAGGRGMCASNNESGRGGGSGGAIYLQATTITITGLVAANGGGGGAPSIVITEGNPGADGGLALTAAFGGSTSGNRYGGNGGARSSLPTIGTTSGNNDGGGGGGAAGRVVLRAANITGAANVSPMPTTLSN